MTDRVLIPDSELQNCKISADEIMSLLQSEVFVHLDSDSFYLGGYCSCGQWINNYYKYCPLCGKKVNWR